MLKEILESHLGGRLIIENYAKTMEVYDENSPIKSHNIKKIFGESIGLSLIRELRPRQVRINNTESEFSEINGEQSTPSNNC